MTKSELAKFVEIPENLRLFQQERLLLDVTELMQCALERTGTRRVDLAKELGVSRGRITQILGGEENLTLRTVADVFTAMGLHLSTTLEKLEVEKEAWYSIDVNGGGHTAVKASKPRMEWVLSNCFFESAGLVA